MSRPSTREPLTEQQREEFIEDLAAGHTVVEAAVRVGRGRRDFYRLKQADLEFAAEWKAAYQEGTDSLVNEAHRRATEGIVKRRTYDKDGTLIGEEIAYSDPLLMFLIKQRDASYRDRVAVEGGGEDAPPIVHEHRGVKLVDVLDVAREAGLGS